MLGNGKGSSWRHCRKGAELRDVTSCHATWSCLLSVGNALSTAYLLCLPLDLFVYWRRFLFVGLRYTESFFYRRTQKMAW